MKKRCFFTITLFLSGILGTLLYLIAKYSEQLCKKPAERPYGRIIDRVNQLLKEQSKYSTFTGEKLLEELGEPRDSIESAFHKSVEAVLEQYRVKEAEQLLRTTDDTISCIATTVGFKDSGALYRPFKRIYGIAPSIYREKQRG